MDKGQGPAGHASKVVVRKRLQPSEKQLKQQQHHTSSGHHGAPQRQKSFSGTTIMAGLYDLEETLGKGHFATVKAAKHVFTGERVAVKVIDKTKLDTVSQKALLKEVLCMKLVQHPNVVKLYEVIDTSSKMYLVLELGQGDLYDLILKQQGGLPEDIARVYFRQIVTAVSYCHKLHVAHRDLKPENVVFFPPLPDPGGGGASGHTVAKTTTQSNPALGQVKLTDFGFSNKFCPGVNLDTSCGSLAYSAPEILLGDSYDAPAVDIWSLGVILYMLVCGRAPFQEANDSETLTMIMDVKYSIPDALSRGIQDLIRRMLVRDPGRRATLAEIEADGWVNAGSGGRKHKGGVLSVDENSVPLVTNSNISEHDRERIFSEMVKGGIVASYDEIRSSLKSNAYNHVTSTYYLLAERFLRDKARCAELVERSKSPGVSGEGGGGSSSSSSSPPMIIRRKNSHQFEDVVLPSNVPKEEQLSPGVTERSKVLDVGEGASGASGACGSRNLAGLDLETGASLRGSGRTKMAQSKFVCLPVIEPGDDDDDEEEDEAVEAPCVSSIRSPRNSSPHHPHYYHHLRNAGKSPTGNSGAPGNSGAGEGGRQERHGGEEGEDDRSRAQSPPLHYRRTKLNKSHHSHSDSSDEGGGGGVAGGNHGNMLHVLVTRHTDHERSPESPSNTSTNERHHATERVLMKPSPSYDNSVGSSGGAAGGEQSKKKRVLFLSWFFKRKGKNRANGIYKTRSCAELKTRACNAPGDSRGVDPADVSVRECFAVCNGNTKR